MQSKRQENIESENYDCSFHVLVLQVFDAIHIEIREELEGVLRRLNSKEKSIRESKNYDQSSKSRIRMYSQEIRQRKTVEGTSTDQTVSITLHYLPELMFKEFFLTVLLDE